MRGRLVGVGVGPGDPDLLTIKGRDALRDADALFVPVAEPEPAGPGYAERVVSAHVPHATPITRLAFSLSPQARDASWETAAAAVAEVVASGATVAFATIGDPNVYSTFTRLARRVRALVPDVSVETVPGITAMQDLAARSHTVLLEGDERLALLPLATGADHVAAALDTFDTVVLYKGGRRLPEVAGTIAAAGRSANAVYGSRLGLDDEDVRDGLPDAAAPYLSTVIVTRDRDDEEVGR